MSPAGRRTRPQRRRRWVELGLGLVPQRHCHREVERDVDGAPGG